jgi:hypothetical protein
MPGTFYGYAFIVGGITGLLFFLTESNQERKELGQIVISAFIYSISIFIVFSIFALSTVRRTVKKYF